MRNKTIVFTVLVACFSFLLCRAQDSQINPRGEISVPYVSIQEDPKNELGLINSVKKLELVSSLIDEGKIQEAQKILLETKEWLTNAADHHYKLSQALSEYSQTSEASKIEKAHALDFAKVRDQSFFLLAKVYIMQNKLKEAVELLIEIIKSQPDSELAKKAYKTLQEIKFSDKPTIL